MMLALYIILGIALWAGYAWVIGWIHDKLEYKRKDMNGEFEHYKIHPSAKKYQGEEHDWNPTFALDHCGVLLFNIPFEPEEKEVFYIENEYDEDANRYVRENIEYIRERLAEKGYSFVYLPELKVGRDIMLSSIQYHNPQGCDVADDEVKDSDGLPSNFLLNYMLHPENRKNIKTGFAWYGKYWEIKGCEKRWYQFDYISFVGKEALDNPKALFEEILCEIGETRSFKRGYYSIHEPEEDESADQYFDDEMKKVLEEVRAKLDAIRLKGISEAVIAKYVQPRPVLSHIRITKDFHIFLDDYGGIEIKMEPLVKAVYILFLRHEDGIAFKDLVDYQVELELIYRAIKNKCNDIDDKLADKQFTPIISENIRKLTNPFDNSINEKCTRIKESFISHFHESTARFYYVQGGRTRNKVIEIPQDLIIWEV